MDMDVESAKLIAAGIAVLPLLGVGIGIGNIFATLIKSIARNPGVQKNVFPLAILGFALTEAVALIALLVSFLILFR